MDLSINARLRFKKLRLNPTEPFSCLCLSLFLAVFVSPPVSVCLSVCLSLDYFYY